MVNRKTLGGIVRRKRSRELRFGEFAPESSAFFWVQKLWKWFHDIWSYFDISRPCTKKSDHVVHDLKDRNAKCRNFLGVKPTSDEFCHKFGRKLWFLKFFDMLSESVKDICMTSSELLANLEIDEFCDWTRKQFFWQTTDKNSDNILDNYPIN